MRLFNLVVKGLKKYILHILITIILVLIIIFRSEILSQIEKLAIWAFPKDENRNGEVTKLIISIIGGLVILVGLRAALIRAKASQKGVEKQSESIENQTSQIKLARISQTNEQFKNAIEHLGSKSESIVLGGISELHFIATENKDKFSEVVLNILCSKIRTEASIKKDPELINNTIIQTIIDYIFKTDIYKGLEFDISFSNLRAIKIINTTIEKCNISYSILPWEMKDVSFSKCQLSKVESIYGRYNNIKIDKCDLFLSKFNKCNFDGLYITNAINKIQKIECLNTQFKNSSLDLVMFNSVFLSCEFHSTNFNNNNLTDIDFTCSDFYEVKFNNSEIYGCNFVACNFIECETNNLIHGSYFTGIKNDVNSFNGFHKDRLKECLDTNNNYSGLKYNEDLFKNNFTSKLNDMHLKKRMKIYKKLNKNNSLNIKNK